MRRPEGHLAAQELTNPPTRVAGVGGLRSSLQASTMKQNPIWRCKVFPLTSDRPGGDGN